ncbi:hypothetical protein V1477_005123 [Vespula maculifrons]|uniref:Uncharacterized protein n=3 Tax=Vespula TaxID=7451 RepID=A0A834PAC2_VESPE|nr:hypothetical protein HZH66_002103 [Vespula vulgaris]KAF7434396.1 hypothetical protein H0235_002587 [Vespula pensylvanica]
MAEDPPSDAQQHLVEDITYGSNRVLSRTIRGTTVIEDPRGYDSVAGRCFVPIRWRDTSDLPRHGWISGRRDRPAVIAGRHYELQNWQATGSYTCP